MSQINRHNNAGDLNQAPNDKALKVEVHPNSHTSLVNVYSEDRLSNSTYSQARYSIGGEILQSKVNKLAMFSYDMRYNVPNINSRNNIITFFSTASGLNHTVTLDEEHYLRAALMIEIRSKLNTVSGASLLTFSEVETFDSVYELSAVGGSFRFLSSSHIDRAAPCSGLLKTTGNVSSMLVVVGAQYTDYIDVVIESFRDAQILQNSFTKDNIFPSTGHMFRIPIDQFDSDAYCFHREQFFNLNFVTIRNKQLNTLEISLYDQFGELVYTPTQQLANQVFNIPLIKYEMKFTISA